MVPRLRIVSNMATPARSARRTGPRPQLRLVTESPAPVRPHSGDAAPIILLAGSAALAAFATGALLNIAGHEPEQAASNTTGSESPDTVLSAPPVSGRTGDSHFFTREIGPVWLGDAETME